MWVMCSWQSWEFIKALTIKYEKLSDDPIKLVAQDALWDHRLRPTNILAQWLPILFLSIWIFFLGWLIWSAI